MTEYIDREEAKAKIREKFKFVPARIEINEVLNSIPAADVREVVTCNECVYFLLNSCMRWADGTFMGRTDFCSRGVKREES